MVLGVKDHPPSADRDRGEIISLVSLSRRVSSCAWSSLILKKEARVRARRMSRRSRRVLKSSLEMELIRPVLVRFRFALIILITPLTFFLRKQRTTMASSTSNRNKDTTDSSKASYDAFNAVDRLVAKPVMGSDGAAAWQEFRQGKLSNSTSSAPKAPLKAADRAAGFTSWEQERQTEMETRKAAGEAPMHAGYTTFKAKDTAEQAAERKRRERIEKRIRPDEAAYYVPAENGFVGWKFDYIFTTRDRGTGYYWDGMDSVKKLRGELIETTPADEPSRVVEPSEGNGQDSTPLQKRKKKKRKKLEGPTIVNDPNNPMEQIAAALQKKNRQSELLPPGWEAAKDASSDKIYYYNRTTGERSWEQPGGTEKASENNLPAGWSSAKDPTTGKKYYYHAATKETRWDRPSS